MENERYFEAYLHLSAFQIPSSLSMSMRREWFTSKTLLKLKNTTSIVWPASSHAVKLL